MLCAKPVVGDEPFAVLLADDLLVGQPPVMKQMTDTYDYYRCSVVGVLDLSLIHTYGGVVRTPADLYKMGLLALFSLERMADKSACNLLAASEKSKHTTLARFIYTLGIRNVGEARARDPARHFGSLCLSYTSVQCS